MSRRLVIGDIHGAHRALRQVFERCEFNHGSDRLICLGDIVDGWNEVAACVEELSKVKNLVLLRGNHDQWFLEWAYSGAADRLWLQQGGEATVESYAKLLGRPGDGAWGRMTWIYPDIPETHKKFLAAAKLWHQEPDDYIFVHGGWNIWRSPHPMGCSQEEIMWDRSLWQFAVDMSQHEGAAPITRYPGVFIGHTTTEIYGSDEPMERLGIWNLDTGAGWSGKLTIMDIDTKEYWQSDRVPDLYPGQRTARRV